MLNVLWLAMILGAVVCGSLNGTLDAVSRACTDSAAAAVTLALGQIGVMAFWLGLVQVLHKSGVLGGISRLLRPIMVRVFPEVPADHPAMSMMILNMTANVLGLGNAATPFGLKAMAELDRLNPLKGTATNAMVTFLAINTSGLAVLPTGMIALRASLGSTAPGAIFFTTLVATSSATVVGVIAAKVLSRLPAFAPKPGEANEAEASADAGPSVDLPSLPLEADVDTPRATTPVRLLRLSVVAVVVGAFAYALWQLALTSPDGWLGALKAASSQYALLILLTTFVLIGLYRGVGVYSSVVEGGRQGFEVALRIIPYLVAMLVAVGMLRASGAIDMGVQLLEPITAYIGMPAEALPMALLRPLSGQGAYGVAAEIMKVHGPDTLVGQIVSTIMGSTETTFYVLALYCGVVNMKRARHTIVACLAADVTGIMMAVWTCRWFLT